MAPDRRALARPRTIPITVPRLGGAATPVRAPRFWRSLRWRLTIFYTTLLALILILLGIVLLYNVSNLLLNNAYQTFVAEAKAVALARHGQFAALSVHRSQPDNNCATPYSDAFQTIFSDPLTQPPTDLITVALLDRVSGVAVAPLAQAGAVPPDLHPSQLAALDAAVTPPRSHASWGSGEARGVTITYPVTVGGAPGAVILIAYDYRTCAGLSVPAVLMMERSFGATQAIITSFKVLLAISVGALFVLGLAVGIVLTQASLGPLARVSGAARRLAAGDLSQRVGLVDRRDEVGVVGETFDEMAETLQEVITRLQESDERMRQFLSDASHELRSPIQAIGGTLDVVLRGGFRDPNEVAALLRNARRESDRMARLVNDLLTLARFDVGRPLDLAWTNLGEVAGDAVDQARLLAGGRVVSFTAEAGIVALVDPDRVKQTLVALLDNALKYGRQDDSGVVRVALHRAGPTAVITIRDNGPGIPPEYLATVFERFNRGQRSGKGDGSGLGLAIARTIIQAHGGAINAQNVPEGGAVFLVALPVAGPPVAAGDLLTRQTLPLPPGALPPR